MAEAAMKDGDWHDCANYLCRNRVEVEAYDTRILFSIHRQVSYSNTKTMRIVMCQECQRRWNSDEGR